MMMISMRVKIAVALTATFSIIGACTAINSNTSTMATTAQPTIMLVAQLAGSNEVPPNTSPASGMVKASLNTQTNLLSWTVTYAGLTGPASAGHFHGPAASGTNAGVVLPLSGDLQSPIKGMATLNAAQTNDLMAGKWYMNLHTSANPNGEIRGQVSVKP